MDLTCKECKSTMEYIGLMYEGNTTDPNRKRLYRILVCECGRSKKDYDVHEED